jgi:hypothetical protein
MFGREYGVEADRSPEFYTERTFSTFAILLMPGWLSKNIGDSVGS